MSTRLERFQPQSICKQVHCTQVLVLIVENKLTFGDVMVLYIFELRKTCLSFGTRALNFQHRVEPTLRPCFSQICVHYIINLTTFFWQSSVSVLHVLLVVAQ
jgi:hypothetical protein